MAALSDARQMLVQLGKGVLSVVLGLDGISAISVYATAEDDEPAYYTVVAYDSDDNTVFSFTKECKLTK